MLAELNQRNGVTWTVWRKFTLRERFIDFTRVTVDISTEGDQVAGYTIQGTNIIGPDGEPFIARGVNLGSYKADGNVVPTSQTDWAITATNLAGFGFNAARIVLQASKRFSWSLPASSGGWGGEFGWAASARYATDLIVKYRAAGLVVIPELHDFTASPEAGASPEVVDQWWEDARLFWVRLAERFKDDSGVWFNLCNEPYTVNQEWFTRFARLCFAIRRTGAKNPIMVDAPKWGQDIPTNGEKFSYSPGMAPALRDVYGNIIVSMHNYGARARDEAQTRSYVETVWAANLPLVFGEIGWPRRLEDNPGLYETNKSAAKATMAVAADKGVGVLWWATAFNDYYGIWYADNKFIHPWDATLTTPTTEGGAAFLSWVHKMKLGVDTATSDSLTNVSASVAGRSTDCFDGGSPQTWASTIIADGRARTIASKGLEVYSDSYAQLSWNQPDVSLTFTLNGAANDLGVVVLRGPISPTNGAQVKLRVQLGVVPNICAFTTLAANGPGTKIGNGVSAAPGDTITAYLKGNVVTLMNETKSLSESATISTPATPQHVGFKVGKYESLTIKNLIVSRP